jgi:tectonic-1/3
VTGIETNATTFNSVDCATTYHKNLQNYTSSAPTCLFCGGAQQSCPTIPNVPYCQNMVTAVHYTVTHNPDVAGTIVRVIADVVITDVPLLGAPSVEQTFSVQFVSTSSVAPARASGNLVPRSRSGNPGYITGKPVLIGTLRTTAPVGAIDMEPEGLQVATPFIPFAASSAGTFGSSTCPTSDSRGEQSVGFGYDMVTGCEMHLTRGALSSACSSTIPYFLETPSADQYIGQYGNADPLDASQWIKLSKRAATVSPTFNANTGVCSNLVTGLHYKFLVAYTGERAFPQSKIVSAEVEEVVGEWRSNVPYSDAVSTQAFALQVTVSFVYKDASDLTGYVPPAPPVLFKVPHDVFYPFYMSAAAAPAGASWVGVALPVVACMALLVVGGGWSGN